MKNLVSIVIVTHAHRQHVDACLRSVYAQRSTKIETLIVDNASQDGTVPFIRRRFPQVKLIEQTVRRGFAANVNTGIMHSRGKHILVLNPDTVMRLGAMSAMLRRLESKPNIGICGPMLLNPDGTTQLSFRNFPTWKSGIVRRTPLRVFLKNSQVNANHLNAHKNHAVAQPVDWMLGACLMIRRELLDAIGLFDERYPLYVEDIDLCLRAHLAGWEVWYEPAATVVHHHMAKSDASLVSVYSYYHTVGMLRFMKKFWLQQARP